ncbi:MAG TPA: response regulator [Candidatus Dormibacteraeota bacterium]|nr:response regulator [Candidatus Dormibacteraeota bacterium]
MAADDILLIDDDRVIQKMVAGFLERRGYHVRTAADGIEAIRLVRQQLPALVITDVRMPELNGIELTARLREDHRTAAVPILMFSEMGEVQDALAGYAAGADDYLPKPFELAILEAKVLSLLRRSAAAHAGDRGRVILFAHAKGGVGTTSLAVNAAVLLAERSARPVGLLDLDVEFGDSAVYLNLHPNLTLADLKSSPASRINEAQFDGFVTESGSVRLVVGSDLPERAELVTLPAIHLAIDRLSATCDYVLIDAPASFTERTLTALDASDLICLVTSASLPSLRATRACLDFFKKLGVADERVMLALNDSTAHAMGLDVVGGVLGRRPDFTVKRSESLGRAANAGQPLVVSDPHDPLVADLRKLADLLATSAIDAQRAWPSPGLGEAAGSG